MWRLFCDYLFIISPSFGASVRFCFVIVVFLGISLIFFQIAIEPSALGLFSSLSSSCVNLFALVVST